MDDCSWIILTSNGTNPRISRSSKLVKMPNTLTFWMFPICPEDQNLPSCTLSSAPRRWARTTSMSSLPSVLPVRGTGQSLHGGGRVSLESYFSNIFSFPKAAALSKQLLLPFASLIYTIAWRPERPGGQGTDSYMRHAPFSTQRASPCQLFSRLHRWGAEAQRGYTTCRHPWEWTASPIFLFLNSGSFLSFVHHP